MELVPGRSEGHDRFLSCPCTQGWHPRPRQGLSMILVSRQLPSFKRHDNRDRCPIREGQRLLYHTQLPGIIIEHDGQDDPASQDSRLENTRPDRARAVRLHGPVSCKRLVCELASDISFFGSREVPGVICSDSKDSRSWNPTTWKKDGAGKGCPPTPGCSSC